MSDINAYTAKLSRELGIREEQIRATAALLEEGATVPFIARYRKEKTGGLDEVQIITIRDRIETLRELDKRREAILKSLKAQDKLTPELEAGVREAETMARLEDIYLPHRPKRRTRAMVAREKGLEPLALKLLEQGDFDPFEEAKIFIDREKEVDTAEDALRYARDIIAEIINEDAALREKMRELYVNKSVLSSRVNESKKEKAEKYRDYFEWSEPAGSAPSHRILAIRRGAREEFLVYHIVPDEEEALRLMERMFIKRENDAAGQVRTAVQDCYRRLLNPSMEAEMRAAAKTRADDGAIRVFTDNLRELLMASPLGEKNVLALDPGLRTGCKLACLDRQGNLLHHDTIFPLAPFNKTEESASTIRELCKKYDIEAVSLGNGTGGRELLQFCKGIGLDERIPVVMVNESGASVYSASETARAEFPDQDVTVRGAVSIGRRLMDPLAELVKIDPKSIGVGQYQHDVDQKLLKKSLDDVVASCVNAVGVEANTSSKQLLSYVSGLSDRLADAIVSFRKEHGPFRARSQFLQIPGMGQKTFEQAAGFLRIRNGDNPLDASAVHPESYPIVEAMAADLNVGIEELIRDGDRRKSIDLERYRSDTVGLPTLRDIMSELEKPGRDPRSEFELFEFSDEVHEISDLKPGMKLPGVVTNVVAFGAFVDVGVHQDGLVHVSELADRFVKDPGEVVKVHQKVSVTVLDVDEKRSRISLSMKKKGPGEKRGTAEKPGAGKSDKTGPAKKRSGRSTPGISSTGKGPGTRAKKERPGKKSDRNTPFADLLGG